jgi:hypothetical protein
VIICPGIFVWLTAPIEIFGYEEYNKSNIWNYFYLLKLKGSMSIVGVNPKMEDG